MTDGWSAAPNCSIALAKFAGLPCSGKFFYRAPWDFHAYALTHRNVSPGGSGRRSSGETHGCNDRRHQSIFRTWPWHLADAAGDHHLRMRDRAVEFRAALEPRLFHPADEPGIRLGPRRLRPRAGPAEPVVGPRPADRGRHRRPLRRHARDDRRRAALCRRPVDDALFDDAAFARSRRRRADRLWSVRLFVQSRAVGFQQAAAGGEARPCARRRHRGGLVRAIPVRAVRRRDDRQFRLAGGADGVRFPDAADRAAVARARDAAVDGVGTNAPAADQQSFKTALAEAFGHRSYVLLVLGFFTCGFQLAFITVHLPAYLADRGVSAQTGGWVVAAIGLFNIIGSLSVGWLQNKYPKRYILSIIYLPARCRSWRSSRFRSPPSRRSCSAPQPA